MTHEEGLRRFLLLARRARFVELLRSPKGRKKLCSALQHFRWLDDRFVRCIPPRAQTPDGILHLLCVSGAPDRCHVLSEDPAIDGRELDLAEVLSRIVGMGAGTLVSCIPGMLAYYEGEGPEDRCILEREA